MSSPDPEFSSDRPLQHCEQDRFGRRHFAARIAQIISERKDPSCLIVGLHGVWGDGKTSVLNFVSEELTKTDKVICVHFNPWRFSSEDVLLAKFFNKIAEVLDEKLKTKTDSLKDIVKKGAPAAGVLPGGRGFGQAIASFIDLVNIEELKERLESLLEKSNKRVLVLIDDIDRLDKEEIHALFRLVKLTANFTNFSYLLAFDKEIVSASLAERYGSLDAKSGEEFLEKIGLRKYFSVKVATDFFWRLIF